MELISRLPKLILTLGTQPKPPSFELLASSRSQGKSVGQASSGQEMHKIKATSIKVTWRRERKLKGSLESSGKQGDADITRGLEGSFGSLNPKFLSKSLENCRLNLFIWRLNFGVELVQSVLLIMPTVTV